MRNLRGKENYKLITVFKYRGFEKRGVYCSMKGKYVSVKSCRKCDMYRGYYYGFLRCLWGD